MLDFWHGNSLCIWISIKKLKIMHGYKTEGILILETVIYTAKRNLIIAGDAK